jgi:hypothetical protein
MSDIRRLLALLLAVFGLGVAMFGVVRGLSRTGPAHGVRMVVSIDPPVDAAALETAVHVVEARVEENGTETRVSPGGDNVIVEVGTDSNEKLDLLAELLERRANLRLHVVDDTNPWLARVAAAAAADHEAGVRVEGGLLLADDRRELLAVAEADAIDCTGPVEDGHRSCLLRGDRVLARYLDRHPGLAVPADRVVAYRRVGASWRPCVLQPSILDGHALQQRAETVADGVIVAVPATTRLPAGGSVALVVDGVVHAIGAVTGTTLHVVTNDPVEVLDLVSLIDAGTVHPLHVMKREPFSRATGFLPRAWAFLVIGALFGIAGAVVWGLERKRARELQRRARDFS